MPLGEINPEDLFTPRQYQLEGAKFISTKRTPTQRGSILADAMGVGKTGQACIAWHNLGLAGPALLIARPSTQSVWLNQAWRWKTQTPYIIDGQKKQRLKLWDEVSKYSFMASTLETIRQDIDIVAKIPWQIIIMEEAHKVSNRKTSGWKTVKKLHPEHFILITGSPMRRGFGDLWALLNICDPTRWSSYWGYLQSYGFMQKNEYGAWEVLGLKEGELLARAISPYYLSRTMPEEVPAKTRILDHKLNLTDGQAQLYDDLVEEMVSELSDGSMLVAQNDLVRLTRLRQILCTPKILDPNQDYGALLEHLGEMLEDTDDHHFVVFTPFSAAIPIIRHYLLFAAKIDQEKIFSLQGGLKALEVSQIIEAWQKAQGVMICTIPFAESFDLVPATWAYFCGFAWSPDSNLQAEDRLRRMTTKVKTFFYYPTHIGRVDEQLVLEVCNEKAGEMLKVYNSYQGLRRLLGRENSMHSMDSMDSIA